MHSVKEISKAVEIFEENKIEYALLNVQICIQVHQKMYLKGITE